jgi:exonuclease SbcC
MLSWIFKKFGRTAAPATATPSARKTPTKPAAHTAAQQALQTERSAEQKAAQKKQQLDAARAEWAPRLQAALGGDAALLALAQATPLLDLKLAAVEALSNEASLKQAEREFRSHDRRVHRLAKTRLEAAVAQRLARAQAQALIANATELSQNTEAALPVNVLLALDRDWQALTPELLEPAQIEQFLGLSAALNAQLRQRSELEQAQQRWSAEATQALKDWLPAAEQAASSGQADDLSAPLQTLQALQQSRPALTSSKSFNSASSDAVGQAIDSALSNCTQLAARLTWLQDSTTEAEAQQWQAMAPLTDAGLSHLLKPRFEQWLRVHAPAPAPTADADPAERPAKPARKRPSLADISPAQVQQLQAQLALAEAAQSAGQLSEMQQQLQHIDDLLHGISPASLAEDERHRHQALLAERGRLRDWEQWGGARALDALVEEAEALAQATLAATAPAGAEAVAEPNEAATAESAEIAEIEIATEPVPAPTKPAAKLNLKAQREAIQDLRKRWKEVDRLSAGAGHALWQRFDAALQTANLPVAAQLAELKAAREANLASRELLLSQLDSFAAPDAALSGEAASAQWKECLRELSAFQLAWRQLGPVEHTVPLANRNALLQRQRASIDRIELPLQQARRAAEAQREQLIQQAEALRQDLQQNPQLRDVTQRVRDLQAEWQHQARSLALARAAENDLWARFKAATDAVFAQRSAAFDARDEALASSLADYEALLARLSSVSTETPDAEIRRTLAEVDRAWRQGGELPRGVAVSLDARLQAAHQQALQVLSGRSQLIWQTQCEALAAKLALCEGQDAGVDNAAFATEWAALPALPEAWERALAQRAPASSELDELLLQLEAALDLPASAEMLAARRQLKLKALKDALEGRLTQQQGPHSQAAWLCAALQASQASPAQQERLRHVVKALSQAPAGTFLIP